MDQDRVQKNAPDYDTDIDRPQPPRRQVNTAVVSVQDHFTLSESEIWMSQNHKQKTIQQKSELTQYTTILKSLMGMKISPQTFKLILQHHIKLQQNTMLTQKKYQN